MRTGSIVVAVALMSLWSAAASGAVVAVQGKKLLMKASLTAGKVVFLATDVAIVPPSPGGPDDPTIAGATLDIFSTVPGAQEEGTFDLPASNWTVNAAGTVYKFDNPAAPAGPSAVRKVKLKAGKLKVITNATGITLDEPAQTAMGVLFTSGTSVHCAEFASPSVRRDEPGYFLAKNAAAPAACATVDDLATAPVAGPCLAKIDPLLQLGLDVITNLGGAITVNEATDVFTNLGEEVQIVELTDPSVTPTRVGILLATAKSAFPNRAALESVVSGSGDLTIEGFLHDGLVEAADGEVLSLSGGPSTDFDFAVGTITFVPGLPASQQPLAVLACDPSVTSIEASKALDLDLDVSTSDLAAGGNWRGMNAQILRAFPPFDLTADGAAVGIIDTGIDTDHEDFQDAMGDTRILTLWDQTLAAPDCAAAPFPFGRECDANAIDAGAPTEDAKGHGTHVAGIAAGNGAASAGTFTGVAPEADIIAVKKSGTQFSRDVALGAVFIYLRATQQGLPVVINQSNGTHSGPHDGTDVFSALLSAMTGPGRLHVKSAGNENEIFVHAENDGAPIAFLAAGPAGGVDFIVRGERNVPIEIWSGALNLFGVRVTHPVAGALLLVPPGGIGLQRVRVLGQTQFVRQTNNLIGLGGSALSSIACVGAPRCRRGRWNFILTRFGPLGDGHFDAYAPVKRDRFTPGFGSHQECVSEPGNATDLITVASFISNHAAPLGGIAPSSNHGPVRTNLAGASPAGVRKKPDVAAPGRFIEAPCSSLDDCDGLDDEYTRKSGTSMATPHLAGCIALMLEVAPGLAPSHFLSAAPPPYLPVPLLLLFSRTDAQSAAAPDNTWGIGKLDCGVDTDGGGTPDLIELQTGDDPLDPLDDFI